MNRIQELRTKIHMQQKALAIELKVSQATISSWELGDKNPSSKNAAKLADFFGVSIDYLLGRDVATQKDKIKPTVDDDGRRAKAIERVQAPSEGVGMYHQLKQLRKEKGLTQDQLSELLHISQGAISKWEKDPQKMSIEQSAELARFFDVSLECFLGLSSEKENKNSPSAPGAQEITRIYQNLSDDNRAKLLELARLYQGAQQKNEENQ